MKEKKEITSKKKFYIEEFYLLFQSIMFFHLSGNVKINYPDNASSN